MQISEIRSRLIKQREQILEQRNSTNTSWQKLKEPEVEFEEAAAKEKMAGVLAQLDDREKQEIEQIDTALAKIRTGGFGMCESCGRQIAESRIKAIPWASFCIDCAEKQEQGTARVTPPLEKSPDISRDKTGQGYNGTQIKEMIQEQLDLDHRVETDELIVYGEDGWVYLEGCLPSRTQHEILMGIVQDVLGFKDIVDQVQIDRQLWERQKYTKQGQNTPLQQWKEKKMHSQGGETDVWTSREFGIPMAPPDKLDPEKKLPRRYLWTDAFAVCNFLALYWQTRDEVWLTSAKELVGQVHFVLGRHREDDPRNGWISGLGEKEGKQHPTRGGLRIGKPLNERRPDEPFDQNLEWDRDGQYYHYLTKWMHALNQVARVTGDPVYSRWAVELAQSAHAGFVHAPSSGTLRMYWKMRIDLSSPLVPSMGQHDPLDGLITYSRLQATASQLFSQPDTSLKSEIAHMASLCQKMPWETSDPLGVGGLLCDALTTAQLHLQGISDPLPSLHVLLKDGLSGMDACINSPSFKSPPEFRLAFRELGMTIGLHAIQKLAVLVKDHPDVFKEAVGKMQVFEEYYGWCDIIEGFWLAPENQQVRTWTDHRDINQVMLAASLLPD